MDSSKTNFNPISDCDAFFDALDAFPPPDPQENLDPSPPPPPPPPPPSPISSSSSIAVEHDLPQKSPSSLRRRRSRIAAGIDTPGEKQSKNLSGLKEEVVADKPADSRSTLTSDRISTGRDEETEIIGSSATSAPRDVESSLLESIAGFVIKAIIFQLGLLIGTVKFPFWLLYFSFLLVIDPLGSLRRARDGIMARSLSVWKILLEKAGSLVHERLGSQHGVGRLAMRLIWGSFWAIYVSIVLSGLLAAAFLGGGVLMGRIVEEPVQMKEDLNFDYTKASPVALVPISSCFGDWGSSEGKGGSSGHTDRRLVPPNHKLQLTITLTLPESDYNRKLGVFQVRVEFLSAEGKVKSTTTQPSMLRFKSSYMHFLETFLKSVPLLAGYSSEEQVLKIRMRGFTEGLEPTTCIRIILEQRAEFRAGAGIPEIYAASLKLESELPLFKRITWSWRRTVFIWISMGLFIFELLIVLVCCNPVLLPRTQLRGSHNR
ncbi:seipin-2-like [Typha angustifolia]|uniref:seipin-2-like n=1 Tax=Typha angustifolia TaxID=59011 RepID=UPI003C2D2A19